MSNLLECDTLEPIRFERWPYDEFYALLLPSGKGEVYRVGSDVCLGTIARRWEAWLANDTVVLNGYTALFEVVSQAIAADTLNLTEAQS